MIRIRLRRTGKKHRPSYRLVVADKPSKRDGAFLETLGSYDPHSDPPLVTVDAERVKSWIGKGAQPSDAAAKILRRAGVITTPAPVRKMVAPVAAKAAAAAPVVAAPVAVVPVAAAEPPVTVAEPVAEVAEVPVAEPAEAIAEVVEVPASEPAEAVAEVAETPAAKEA